MSWNHPSDRHLLLWTEAGKGRRTAHHVVHCSLCEQRLETLTELAPRLRAELRAALAPSSTFEQQLQERLNQRLLNEETYAVLGDLMEVGLTTSRLLLEPGPEDDEDDG